MEGDGGEIGYIQIRVLGRGAFGEAVLYRKHEDNSLVVWKEIDLRRLSDKERRDAQNEIDILAMVNHANIVSYYNHFLDGETLLIEMEYCNGGNLHEKISAQKELFREEVVLWYFYQVAAAMAHIHEYGILHRDVKTLNIFLTKSALIKLGDFGISRVLDSKSQMAESYVGTPYYMSPELIKGEQYNQKSDIWAMGCVLYELLTLTKVFDATNPLKLASEIVCSEFEDIDPKYSRALRTLLYDMLNKEPSKRPTAEIILKYDVFKEVSSDIESRIWELNSSTRKTKMSVSSGEVQPVVTSKTSEVYHWGGGKLTPQKLELFTKGKSALQVSTGHSHHAVVTVEKELYTWASAQFGAKMVGQLGHGDTAAYKAPRKVQDLDGIAVKQASCGEDFTVCVTDEGTVYAFGSDYYGCLGCDNVEGEEVCTPALLNFFTSCPVEQVSCGDAHVVALTKAGEVFTWGCGEFGRLGLGSEDDYASPQKVKTRGRHGVRSVHAGTDGTFLVKTNGRVLACGSNESNKLGFNSAAHGLRKHKEQISYDIPCRYTFSTVKPLSKHQVVTVSAGRTHSAVTDSFGHLVTFGSNHYGQLGVGDFKERTGVHVIGGILAGQWVTKVACGDNFTVVSTADNQIYSWGTADHGCLGTISSDQGRGPGGMCFSLPRPIFGSLHVVSDLACRYWHTILVADKVLAQKTIRSSNFTTKSGPEDLQCSSTDSVFTEHPHSEASGDGVQAAKMPNLGESTLPIWLKQELADSEFIPVSGGHESSKAETTAGDDKMSAGGNSMDSSIPAWLKEELKSSEFIPAEGQRSSPPAVGNSHRTISECTEGSSQSRPLSGSPVVSAQVPASESALHFRQLEARVKELEAQNRKLQELAEQQLATIQKQADTIHELETKVRQAQSSAT